MNQVQEMLRLASEDRGPEGVERLMGLFALMARQPGFLGAEVLQSIDTPEMLLALHAWRDLADWQGFQRSQEKIDFSATRPEALYQFVPCGMNWRSAQADGDRVGGLLRREVLRDDNLALRSGVGIVGCQTFVYQDNESEYGGCSLRLTRLRGALDEATLASDGEVLVDELYESLITVAAPAVEAGSPSTAQS